MADLKHIERIGETVSLIHANLDLLQIAITTDDQENLLWSNDDASRIKHAAIQKYWNGASYVYEDNEMNDLELKGDLLVSQYIKRAAGTDDRIDFQNDRIAISAGGVEGIVVEDNNAVLNVPVGVKTTPHASWDVASVIQFSDWLTDSHIGRDGSIYHDSYNFCLGFNTYQASSSNKRFASYGAHKISMNVESLSIGYAASGAPDGDQTFLSNIHSYASGVIFNYDKYSGAEFRIRGQTNDDFFYCSASSERIGCGIDDPVSMLELSDTDASPVLTITAKHNTDYDPQIQFRTDATPTVKASMGVDSGDSDKFKIRMGAGAGGVGSGTADFVVDSTGNVGIGINAPTRLLHLDFGTGASGYIQMTKNASTGQAASDGLLMGLDSTDNDFTIWHQENSDIYFGTNNLERMRINNNGYIFMPNLRYELNPTGTIALHQVTATGEIITAAFS